MAYQTEIVNDVKTWLSLEDEVDDVLSLLTKTSARKITSFTNNTTEDIDTDEDIYNCIMYDVILTFNKLYMEGKSNTSGALSETFLKEIEISYKMLIVSINKPWVAE